MVGRINDIWELHSGEDFSSRPYYSASGDCIFWYIDKAENYAERVDEVLTLYRSLESGAIVGFQIKGVTAIIDLFRDVEYNFHNDEVDLKLLLAIGRAKQADQRRNEHRLAEAYKQAASFSRDATIGVQELMGV